MHRANPLCAVRPVRKRKESGETACAIMTKYVLRAANSVISFIVAVSLCMAGLYAAYALWDNSRIYSAAENVQADLVKLKPAVEEDGGASFEELLAINPDVCAWVTLDNTKVDYPILQGETNLTYINTDVYGEFALAGSIFLDSRNDNGFTDEYSLLYGHHMENGSMFGDLDLYKEEEFFRENTTGTLILPDRAYNLEIFACLLVNASDEFIYKPERWQAEIDELLPYVREKSMYLHEDVLTKLEQMSKPQILALSTCSSEFTDARTIILAAMESLRAANQEVK